MTPLRRRRDETDGLEATYSYRISFPLPAEDRPTAGVVEAAFRIAARAHGLGIGAVLQEPGRVRVRVSVPARMSPLEAAGLLRGRAEAWIGKTLPDSGSGADPLPAEETLVQEGGNVDSPLLVLASVRM